MLTLLTSCVQVTAQPAQFPTYDPFLPIPSNTVAPVFSILTQTETPSQPTATREATPTRVPLTFSPPPSSEAFIPSISPQPGVAAELIADTPTPDSARILPTPRQDAEQYIVQAGDTLGHIAGTYGISVEALMQNNNITDPNMLEVGAALNVPAPSPGSTGTGFKVIPDSEMVYGPTVAYFNIKEFVGSQNGYLETYEEDINGITLAGFEVVWIVARNYSVNPRLLLALLEYQSGWVTNPAPFNTEYPMGFLEENHRGLYRQLTWTANNLNQGYYLWKSNAISTYVLNDGTVVPIDPTINAGTVAIQYLFAQFDDRATWDKDVSGTGLMLTYYVFFGNPFNYAIEPLISMTLAQPPMELPFNKSEAWYYTGGPHGGWDSGSAWSALDFAPPGENAGCATSPYWVTAVADGLILRASNGAVLQDLDNDGYENTGWVILYMHVATEGRVNEGEYLFSGERVGHPSCEGGISNATHIHIARKYNGEWITADGSIPFNLSGWVSSGGGREYDGYLTRGNATIEAFDSANDFNLVYH
jgi:LysM repeat protein